MTGTSIFSKKEAEFLNAARVGRIATVDQRSRFPHVVPVCFVFDGTSFYTTLSRGSKRLKNIENGSKASLLVDRYQEQSGEWTILQGLLIETDVCLLSYHKNEDLFMKGWRLLIEKYPQYRQWAKEDLTPRDPERRIVMQLQPTEKTSWGVS